MTSPKCVTGRTIGPRSFEPSELSEGGPNQLSLSEARRNGRGSPGRLTRPREACCGAETPPRRAPRHLALRSGASSSASLSRARRSARRRSDGRAGADRRADPAPRAGRRRPLRGTRRGQSLAATTPPAGRATPRRGRPRGTDSSSRQHRPRPGAAARPGLPPRRWRAAGGSRRARRRAVRTPRRGLARHDRQRYDCPSCLVGKVPSCLPPQTDAAPFDAPACVWRSRTGELKAAVG
jgi:hypothetical protein